MIRNLARTLLPLSLRRQIGDVRGRLRTRAAVDEGNRRENGAYAKALREGVVPPPHLWNLVGHVSDFVGEGRSFFEYLVEHGSLGNESRVLDVGCGLGRMAIHFALFLRSPGYYRGFDVEARCIRWCRDAISSRFPLASFQHADLTSQLYNPGATTPPSRYRFPYADGEFDLVFLASVFTHLMGPELERYLGEIRRVLKPGGRCVATFYLLNDRRRAEIASGGAAFTFGFEQSGAMVERPEQPEDAVAHEEARVLSLCEAVGLRLAEPVRYGAWSASPVQDQDFLVLEAV